MFDLKQEKENHREISKEAVTSVSSEKGVPQGSVLEPLVFHCLVISSCYTEINIYIWRKIGNIGKVQGKK